MINGEFVGNGYIVFSQPSVVVERSHDIFHYLALQGSEFSFHHLQGECIVKALTRFVSWIPRSTAVSRAVAIYGQFVVVAEITECIVELRLPFFPFALCVEVIVRRVVVWFVVVVVKAIVGLYWFESGIIVNLRPYAFSQLSYGEFCQSSLQYLHLRSRLFLRLLLGLTLYLSLCHDI